MEEMEGKKVIFSIILIWSIDFFLNLNKISCLYSFRLRDTARSNFHSQSKVFVIALSRKTITVDSGSDPSSPSLVLVSKEDDSNHRPEINCHLGDPHAIVVSLLEPLDAYGDDGAKTLWVIRTVLKFMKAAEQIQQTTGTTPNSVPAMQSRL